MTAGPAPSRTVRRRKVFYVSGFDPRGPLWYYTTYVQDSRKQAKLSGMRIEVSKRERPWDHVVAWTVSAEQDGIATETRYTFLRWDDIVRKYWPRGTFRMWKVMARVITTYLRTGVLQRVLRTSWPTFIAGFFPTAFVLGLTIVSLLICGLAALLVRWLFDLSDWLVWPLALAAAVWLTALGTHVLDRKFAIHWLSRIYDFNVRQARRQTPELDARLDQFAHLLAEDIARGDADEVLIVGHSTGAQTAASLLARTLALDPRLGRHGSQVSFMTLGGSISMLSWQPESTWFREGLARIAHDPAIGWHDFSIAQDGATFALHDPVTNAGIARPPGEPKPKLLSLKLFDLFSPEEFRTIRRNWLRVHFQYLMASQQQGDYDYFAITAGPKTLQDRFAHRQSTRNFDRFKLKLFGR